MKHLVFALSFALLALGACATTDGDSSESERLERRPGYWDPK